MELLRANGPGGQDILSPSFRVAHCFGITGADWAQELVTRFNAHDGLVGACRAAKSLLAGGSWGGKVGAYQNSTQFKLLTAALAQLEE